jgi:Pyridoxamine 5'-phosphate oxidase
MGKQYTLISETLQAFIKAQKIYFVATAAKDGQVNVSPKGLDSLRVIDKNKVVWLNLTGSGNETAAHLLDTNRMTLMFCDFDDRPMILRLYGTAKTIHPRDALWQSYAPLFDSFISARQIFEMQVDLVQTSCGFGVPLFDYQGERDNLVTWADAKGEDGIKDYWAQKNQTNIDGKATGIF